jgi:flagellar biosynthesis/type III secretory pathway protein FliH
MTYVTLIKTPILNCSTSQLVITKDQVRCINKINLLVDEIKALLEEQKTVKVTAEEKGYYLGYKVGLERSQKDNSNLFSEYLIELSEEVISKCNIQKNTIIDLALAITKKIVSSMDSEEIIMGITNKAISHFKEKEKIKIQVNSKIAKSIKTKLQDKYGSDDSSPYIEIIDDPSIDLLDCIITSEYGVVDASFNEQLQVLKHHLAKEL